MRHPGCQYNTEERAERWHLTFTLKTWAVFILQCCGATHPSYTPGQQCPAPLPWDRNTAFNSPSCCGVYLEQIHHFWVRTSMAGYLAAQGSSCACSACWSCANVQQRSKGWWWHLRDSGVSSACTLQGHRLSQQRCSVGCCLCSHCSYHSWSKESTSSNTKGPSEHEVQKQSPFSWVGASALQLQTQRCVCVFFNSWRSLTLGSILHPFSEFSLKSLEL